MKTVMPPEHDPRTGRFGQRQASSETGDIEGSGYEAIVLERLAKHACRIAGVDHSAIFVRDRRDPRVVIAAAGHRLSWDFTGSRIAADQGFVAETLAYGASVTTNDPAEIEPMVGGEGPFGAAAAAPIRSDSIVVGAVCVLSDDRGHVFD